MGSRVNLRPPPSCLVYGPEVLGRSTGQDQDSDKNGVNQIDTWSPAMVETSIGRGGRVVFKALG